MRALPLPVIAAVRGVSFHQDVVSRLKVGDRVTVVAQPDNPYDANACAFVAGGDVFGHLPKEIAPRLVADGAGEWDGEVVELITGDHPTGVRVRISPRASTQAPVCERGSDTQTPTRQVSARSGRVLGTLAGADAGKVTVLTPDGRHVLYPSELVVVA